MTLVLLDTNAYLRLAKRVRPLLGKCFGQKDYILTILRDVEDEVRKSPRLQRTFPWFTAAELAAERTSHSPRLNAEEKMQLEAATSVLHGLVRTDPERFMVVHRSPPSPTDCRVLAFGLIRPAVVVTDDLGMHELASMAGIKPVWHGYELLQKMLSAKLIEKELVREIFEALEANHDLPKTWAAAKHSVFLKIFGKVCS